MAQRLEPGLRQQLQEALEKIDQGLKDASAGRNLIGVLLNDQANSSQVEGSPMMDTYHEMVTTDAESDLKKDPAIGILDEENDSNHSMLYIWGCCGPKTPIVHPDNTRLLLWTILGIFFIHYEVFVTPYRLCFNAPAEGLEWYFASVITVYFLIDIVLNFFITFYDDEQHLIKSHKMIIKTYVKGWFIIDFLASIPYDWIQHYMTWDNPRTDHGPSEMKMLRLLRALRYLRLMRLFRIAKLQEFNERFEQEIEGSSFKTMLFTVLKMVLLLNVIAHFAGCLWYLIGTHTEDHFGVSWLTGKMSSYNVDQSYFKITLYMWSYYYTLDRLTLGGDISPTNTVELVFTTCVLWIALLVFSGVVGCLMNLISRNYEEGQDRRRRLEELAKYMNWRVLPRPEGCT
jgi:hypothetical protein